MTAGIPAQAGIQSGDYRHSERADLGSRLRGSTDFSEVALKLAGIAGWHLGWSADQFWQATPAEMECVVRAMLGTDGQAEGMAPSPGEIARLKEMFPDG